jgi:hypothetical protein
LSSDKKVEFPLWETMLLGSGIMATIFLILYLVVAPLAAINSGQQLDAKYIFGVGYVVTDWTIILGLLVISAFLGFYAGIGIANQFGEIALQLLNSQNRSTKKLTRDTLGLLVFIILANVLFFLMFFNIIFERVFDYSPIIRSLLFSNVLEVIPLWVLPLNLLFSVLFCIYAVALFKQKKIAFYAFCLTTVVSVSIFLSVGALLFPIVELIFTLFLYLHFRLYWIDSGKLCAPAQSSA